MSSSEFSGDGVTGPLVTCSSLQEVRANIDRVDSLMVRLMREREHYVRQAARFKNTVADVVVPDRIEQIVRKVSAEARSIGGNPELVEKTYRALIGAYIDMERGEYLSLYPNGKKP